MHLFDQIVMNHILLDQSITTDQFIGVLWLAHYFEIELLVRPYVVSIIGKSRASIKEGIYTQKIYPPRSRPSDDVIAHLLFYFKHEIISLEFLSRLFEKIDINLLQVWINQEPTGRYTRRLAFLYEWLTGNKLIVVSTIAGNYVDVLDGDKVVVASKPIKDNRWRVNNNIAGTRHFAPMVLKTEDVSKIYSLNVKERLDKLDDEFGVDLIMRASVWMTLRESRASFAIEGESKQESRIERFARVMVEQVGKGQPPLSHDSLAVLQQEIIGRSLSITHFGVRNSPVFVGESNYKERREIIHYIAPPADTILDKLQGLIKFLTDTQGQSSIMRSAVVAFGFVYIHPLADGNGRIHRFLINDILRRDGQTSESVILPISGAIIQDDASRKAYSDVLDGVSKAVMKSLDGQYGFGNTTQYKDGIKSNLVLQNTQLAEPLWRYMDLTPHTLYLAKLIKQVIEEDIIQESAFLRRYDNIRQAVKNVIEMSNHDADRIIRSILDNKGVRSKKIVKEYQTLSDDNLWTDLVEAVKGVVGERFEI